MWRYNIDHSVLEKYFCIIVTTPLQAEPFIDDTACSNPNSIHSFLMSEMDVDDASHDAGHTKTLLNYPIIRGLPLLSMMWHIMVRHEYEAVCTELAEDNEAESSLQQQFPLPSNDNSNQTAQLIETYKLHQMHRSAESAEQVREAMNSMVTIAAKMARDVDIMLQTVLNKVNTKPQQNDTKQANTTNISIEENEQRSNEEVGSNLIKRQILAPSLVTGTDFLSAVCAWMGPPVFNKLLPSVMARTIKFELGGALHAMHFLNSVNGATSIWTGIHEFMKGVLRPKLPISLTKPLTNSNCTTHKEIGIVSIDIEGKEGTEAKISNITNVSNTIKRDGLLSPTDMLIALHGVDASDNDIKCATLYATKLQ